MHGNGGRGDGTGGYGPGAGAVQAAAGVAGAAGASAVTGTAGATAAASAGPAAVYPSVGRGTHFLNDSALLGSTDEKAWYEANIPFLDVPDQTIQSTYYYRWRVWKEDVAIARRTRQAGLKLGLALGGRQAATRMYHGYPEVLAGMSRGLLPVTGGSRSRLVAGAGWHLLAYTLPWMLAPRRPGWLLPLGLGVAERALVEIKTERRTVWQSLLIPLSPLAAAPIVARARRGNQRWKGRVYP